MKSQTAKIFTKCYAALWFLVGAVYAALILKSTVGSTGVDSGFGYGIALVPLMLAAIAVWLWFVRDIWGKRIVTVLLGLFSTMFVLGNPWLALGALILMVLALIASRPSSAPHANISSKQQ